MLYSSPVLAAAAGIVTIVSGHGFLLTPQPRMPGDAMEVACGAQVFSNQNSDNYVIEVCCGAISISTPPPASTISIGHITHERHSSTTFLISALSRSKSFQSPLPVFFMHLNVYSGHPSIHPSTRLAQPFLLQFLQKNL